MNKLTIQNSYESLLQEIGQSLFGARQSAALAVNTLLVQTYWHIGQHIVEFEQGGKEKADYGSGLLDRLSKDLSALHGKGFSRSNVFYMRKLYLCFQNSETLSHKFKIDYNDERFDNIKYRTTKRTEQPFCNRKDTKDIGHYWYDVRWRIPFYEKNGGRFL